MKTINAWGPLLAASLVLFCASCISPRTDPREASFSQIVVVEDVNRSIQLSPIDSVEEPSVADSIILRLDNLSRHDIAFPIDYGVRGFFYDAEEARWEEAGNSITYTGQPKRLLGSKGGELPSLGIVDFDPVMDPTSAPVELRIVVIGAIYRDGIETEEKVAAFFDVVLQP